MKNQSNIHDAHIHVGQFRDLYSTPQDVMDFLTSVDVDKFAVSSSSTCCGDASLAISEMREMVRVGGERVVPVLWINTEWIADGSIEAIADCGIDWKCLKVHGYFQDWHSQPMLLDKVTEMARKMRLPVLFHTGGRAESDAGAYKNLIKANPDVRFILAHSRPVEQAIEVLKECSNAWADTAFTPFDAVMQMVAEGLEDRMLWGTDYPLHNVFYAGQDIKALYANMVSELQQNVSAEAFEKITCTNFEKLFG